MFFKTKQQKIGTVISKPVLEKSMFLPSGRLQKVLGQALLRLLYLVLLVAWLEG